MAYVCEICGKSTSIGSSQKHRRGVAGKRWRKKTTATPRTFKPNLQKRSVEINGEKKKMLLCTKCIKRIKNFGSVQDIKNISLV